MIYLTGIHALNLPCTLDTCGDWHQSALRWEDLTLRDSDTMFFKEWGIEPTRILPKHSRKYPVANHIRALLDLLEESNFSAAQGMNNDFICNAQYDQEVFHLVYQMRVLQNWDAVNDFMGKEYRMKWLNFLAGES